MKLELFLNEITREMIDSGRMGSKVGDGWGGNVWSKECCIVNFMHQKPGEDIVLPLRGGLLLRAEPDGGLVWSPATNAVYKVDGEAYRVLRDLDAGYAEREAAKRNGVTLQAVRGLLGKMDRAVRQARAR